MSTLPVIIRQWDGNVLAVFPTMPASRPDYTMVYTVTRGLHEYPSTYMKTGVDVSMVWRTEMLKILYKKGYTNMRYYKAFRPWMRRNKRVAEEVQNKIEKRTNQGS